MPTGSHRKNVLFLSNLRVARSKWGDIDRPAVEQLKKLSSELQVSVASGDLLLLDARWYVTHTGLIRLAARRHCSGVRIQCILEFSDAPKRRYAFKATVYKSRTSQGFVGYGDADPSNVSPLVRGAEMRVAETRAVNRALRKAYGIGICSVEEIGSLAPVEKASPQNATGNGNGKANGHANGNRNGNGPRVRDRLCQIIRQHQLDPSLVKAYATDFCGVKTLRDATRDQVENFVVHLADWAEKDRNALLCQLNSYARPNMQDPSQQEASA